MSASRPDEIARTLRDDILRGGYAPGERLPSERDLAASTGANRGSVREALVKLEQLRLIEIRRGGGARVRPLDRASLDVLVHLLELEDPPDRVLVEQWLDVHELVVTGAVRLAVERADAEQLDEARRLLARIANGHLSDDEVVAVMDDLAELISLASRNLVLRMVRNALRALFDQRFPERRELRLSVPALAEIAGAVDRALVKRDALAAEEGVRRLMRAGRERLLKTIEAGGARPARPPAERAEDGP
jgi:GntR family transcriptional repressor for pyruvate dehydrogenase complex